jgi:ferrous iron transport protein A
MRTVLIYARRPMDAIASPAGISLAPTSTSLSALTPGTVAAVIGVGLRSGTFSPLERRLIELGFVSGERIEVLAQAMPGGDPFVVRVGTTTFALRRREVETVWVEVNPATSPP